MPPSIATEPGKTLATAYNLGVVDGEHNVTEFIGTTDATDIYKFTLAQTSRVSLDLGGLTDQWYQRNLKMELIIDRNSNGLIDDDDDLYVDYTDGNNSTANLISTLGAATYFVRLNRESDSTNTNYNLTLNAQRDLNGEPDPRTINLPSNIEITSLEQDINSSEVTIHYNAFDADSEAQVKFFYDQDNQDFDGILITDNLVESDGASSFTWNTEGISPGDYYVYAMVSDGNNPPSFDYSQQRITITEQTDTPVTPPLPNDDLLYQSEYFGKNFSYSQRVANGSYDVALHFAEIYFNQAGRRVFDVTAEDQLILDNFDIYSEAGGKNIALEKTFTIDVNDGALDLNFLAEIDNAKISAVEIKQVEPADTTIRVNGGKENYTDSLGQEWLSNTGFDGGRSFVRSNAIAKTDDDLLYQSEYFGKNFSFSQGLTNGSYDVTLHFAEIYFNQAGRRVFDVTAEDQLILDNFDIYNEAGGKNIALEKTFTIGVNDGALDLNFLAEIDNAKISAVEIKPADITIRVNGGKENYTDSLGQEWLSNTGFDGGRSFVRSNAIAKTDDDLLYQSEYFGKNFSFSQGLTNGSYDVTLHFAEIYFNQAEKRVFDVYAEDLQILDNFDIYSEVGGKNIALEQTFTVNVDDGELNLNFLAEIDNAKVSAIEIEPTQPGESIILTNAGKNHPYTDSLQQEWSANDGLTGGRNFANSNPIAQTDDDLLYQSEYFGQSISYEQGVTNGSYDVTLHFAEVFFNQSGKRVFDVYAEDKQIFDNFDIYDQAGGKNIALAKTFTIGVSDGTLDLDFLAEVDNAKISAIEVRPAVFNQSS